MGICGVRGAAIPPSASTVTVNKATSYLMHSAAAASAPCNLLHSKMHVSQQGTFRLHAVAMPTNAVSPECTF